MKTIVPILVVAVACGCATLSPEAKQEKDKTIFEEKDGLPALASYEERYDAAWDGHAPASLPSPTATPYDHDRALRKIYLDAYQRGVADTLKRKGRLSILDFFPETASEKANADGFDAGRQAVMNTITTRVQQDLEEEHKAWSRSAEKQAKQLMEKESRR